jgi:hypothetical protein
MLPPLCDVAAAEAAMSNAWASDPAPPTFTSDVSKDLVRRTVEHDLIAAGVDDVAEREHNSRIAMTKNEFFKFSAHNRNRRAIHV